MIEAASTRTGHIFKGVDFTEDWTQFTGGRNVILSLDVGDTLKLQADRIDEALSIILICYEYVSK